MLLRLTLLLLLPLTTLAQRYPIQATVTLTPPYSPYLTDLTAPGAQRLALYLHVTDPTLSDYTCKLRLTIEGVGITLRTRPSFQPIAIPLQGGVPQIFYGEDLIDYFNPNNLDFAGLSRSAFAQTHRLPEGVYRFSIEVLDYNRGTVVSNKATATAWIILNDPPLLNLPRTNTKLSVFDPTNIPFTWTPRHTASPNAAFTTEYIFRLFELPATSHELSAASSQLSAGSSQLLTAANQAVLSQQPLYETTLAQSQLVYGPGEPALIPGRWYAWQVQAIDTEGRDLFKNRGKSEVFVFQFGDALGVPQNVRKEAANHQVISIRWDVPTQGDMPEQYRVLYKPTFSDHWYEDVTKERWHNIGYLKPNTTYDIKVRSEKGKQYSEYTVPIQAKTEDESSQFQCGKEGSLRPSVPADALLKLLPGDKIWKRTFTVIVTEAKGGNGYFEGMGWMPTRPLNGIHLRVKFSGQINQDMELFRGKIVTVMDNTPMSNIIDEMEKIGEDRRKEEAKIAAALLPVTITLAGEIAGVTVNPEGGILVTKADGTTETIDHPVDEKTKEKKTVVLIDSAGNSYTAKPDGTVTHNTSSTPGTVTAQQTEKNVIKEKILRLILAEFKTEIAAWLQANGKGGGEDDEEILLAAALPECFPRDEDVLEHINESTIPYYENETNTPELREKIEANPANKTLLDNIANPFNSAADVDFNKVPEESRTALNSATCTVLKDDYELVIVSKMYTAFADGADCLDRLDIHYLAGMKDGILERTSSTFESVTTLEGWRAMLTGITQLVYYGAMCNPNNPTASANPECHQFAMAMAQAAKQYFTDLLDEDGCYKRGKAWGQLMFDLVGVELLASGVLKVSGRVVQAAKAEPKIVGFVDGFVKGAGGLRYGKNFTAKLSSNTSLTTVEKSIAEETHQILNSTEFKKITDGYANKTPVQIEINGRTISYDDAPFSGMTWFEKNGFNIGREAFASEEELVKTVLHEMHRLRTSTLRGSGSAVQVSQETKAAFDYANKAFNLFE